MLKFRILFLLSFVFISALGAQVLENYDGQWKSAREETWQGTNNQVGILLDLKSFPSAEFKIQLPAQSTVFIDEKLWHLSTGDTVFYIGTEALWLAFEKDIVTFTVVSPNLAKSTLSVKKVLGGKDMVQSNLSLKGVPFSERFVPQPVKDFYFTSVLIILFFLALYKLAYPYLLGVLLQPLAVISADDFSDSGNLQKFFSFDILFYLLIASMMLSEVVVIGLVIFKNNWLGTWIGLDYSSLLLIWLVGAFTILALTIVKFVGIRVISYLFDMGKAEFSHFFYLLRLIVFGCALILVVGGYFVSNNFSGLESALAVLFTGFFWFYIFGVLGLFLIMMNRLSFKKYHLFTYLCIAELVPFLILSKLILELGH